MGKFDVKVDDVPFRRTAKGRQLMARVYQPASTPSSKGPFPVLLDLHGGAWNNKDRSANEPMDRALAASGVLVVAIDMTLAPEAPYPASIQDAHYGVRWLKWKAPSWGGDPATLGLMGSSTGGYVAELLILRPRDPRYAAHKLAEAPQLDASVRYAATRSPISDPWARFQHAEKRKREHMVKNSQNYFVPWEAIHEGNPQEILDRREPATAGLRPLLIMQGGLDDNVLPAFQEKFAASWRAAGGECTLEVYADCDHEWVATPGPATDRAQRMVRDFIAASLRTARA
jgi:acetyl esterase